MNRGSKTVWLTGLLTVMWTATVSAQGPAMGYDIVRVEADGTSRTVASGVVDTLPVSGTSVLLASPDGMLWSRILTLSAGFSLSVQYLDFAPRTGVTPSLVFSV